jgi:hypothetical protein
MTRTLIPLVAVVLAAATPASAGKCPDAVRSAIAKAYPESTIKSCKAEKEGEVEQYAVLVTAKDRRVVEIGVAPDGRILTTEEEIPLEQVPKVVLDAFHARYKDRQPTSVEKVTHADGKVDYELELRSGLSEKELLVAEDGTVLGTEDD